MIPFFAILALVLGLNRVVAYSDSTTQRIFAASPKPGPVSLASSGSQSVGNSLNSPLAFDHGLFTPVEDLASLSSTEFTTLDHPTFPAHSVRIKKSHFCDGSVNAYTGYIDVSKSKHIFFYFFESRSSPDADDVIFWTNGGPGGSSTIGAFMELGPCKILDEGGPKYHNESWNSNANIFFVDQPVGVGYSYADYGGAVSTTEEAAQDIAAFVAIFFEHFTKFKGRAFHMAGESFGGRYAPEFASAVYDQNALLVQAGMTPINLQSIIIGNGMVNWLANFESYYDMLCTNASIAPILDISSCVRLRTAIPRCTRWLQVSCYDTFDAMNCKAAGTFCETEVIMPFFKTGRGVYDITKPCTIEQFSENFCYSVISHIDAYLSRLDVQIALGVDEAARGNFTGMSWEVNAAFAETANVFKTSAPYVASLLERGVRALVYAGTYDFGCNWVSGMRWTSSLDWTGKDAFGAQALREWTVNDNVAGKTRSAHGLTFATIDGGGHMAPYDKPKESLYLIQRWLANEAL